MKVNPKIILVKLILEILRDWDEGVDSDLEILTKEIKIAFIYPKGRPGLDRGLIIDSKLYLDGAQMGSRDPVQDWEWQRILALGIFTYMVYRRPLITHTLLKTHIMDATSGQEAALTPTSQFTSQDRVDFSIEDLLKRVDEFQRR
jgi:hypothetical protein